MRFALLALPMLAACVASEPFVSDYNGHTAKVVYHPYALGPEYRKSPAYAKAVETCGSEAVYQGVKALPNSQGEHIFLCK